MSNDKQNIKQNFSSDSTINSESQRHDLKATPTPQTSYESPIAAADRIVNKRADGRDASYGGFTKTMTIMSRIATELCQKEITLDDAYKIMIALKLSRMAQVTPTHDTFTDLIGYTEGWWNALQEMAKEKEWNEIIKR